MNIRILAVSALALMALSPAAFAGTNDDYDKCISRDQPNNGGVPCAQLLNRDALPDAGFKVQAINGFRNERVSMFDEWLGKSTDE